MRNGAIVLDEITGSRDLPQHVADVQAPGTYRLRKRQHAGWFSFASPAGSCKPYLFEPDQCLWRMRRTESGFAAVDRPQPTPRYAFFGIRPCDLQAIAVFDRVFVGKPQADADYAARRRQDLVVVANCTQPAATCFCTTMGTGPKAAGGFDLAFTELTEPSHVLLMQASSPQGEALLQALPVEAASPSLIDRAERLIANAAEKMALRFDKEQIRRGLIANPEHPQWREVANRCLACGNCTLVCPTCFCSRAFERHDVQEKESERRRIWDSCFSDRHSYIHGGSVHATISSRYRQWLTHKLGYWHEQFGVDGCVGCGRCITWCPVGIDLTQEAKAIAQGADYIRLIAGCGKNVHFAAGEFIFREGEAADLFFLLRDGRVALQTAFPGGKTRTVQTLSAGDVPGWSWLFPPYRWHYDAKAVKSVRAVALDDACLRRKCEEDYRLGYEMMKRFSRIMLERLQATRMQLLDVYGDAH